MAKRDPQAVKMIDHDMLTTISISDRDNMNHTLTHQSVHTDQERSSDLNLGPFWSTYDRDSLPKDPRADKNVSSWEKTMFSEKTRVLRFQGFTESL